MIQNTFRILVTSVLLLVGKESGALELPVPCSEPSEPVAHTGGGNVALECYSYGSDGNPDFIWRSSEDVSNATNIDAVFQIVSAIESGEWRLATYKELSSILTFDENQAPLSAYQLLNNWNENSTGNPGYLLSSTYRSDNDLDSPPTASGLMATNLLDGSGESLTFPLSSTFAVAPLVKADPDVFGEALRYSNSANEGKCMDLSLTGANDDSQDYLKSYDCSPRYLVAVRTSAKEESAQQWHYNAKSKKIKSGFTGFSDSKCITTGNKIDKVEIASAVGVNIIVDECTAVEREWEFIRHRWVTKKDDGSYLAIGEASNGELELVNFDISSPTAGIGWNVVNWDEYPR